MLKETLKNCWFQYNYLEISDISKLLNLNQVHLSKKLFFWSNPYKIEVMITSLIEMLELPNFGHMTTSAVSLKSRDGIFLMTRWIEIITS